MMLGLQLKDCRHNLVIQGHSKHCTEYRFDIFIISGSYGGHMRDDERHQGLA